MYMQKSDFLFIAKSFLIWLAGLFIILFFAAKFISINKNFLGIFPFSNFDGEHYISIAARGYGFGERAFFPLYPLSIGFFGKIFGGSALSYTISGILISWTAFFIGLIGFLKLLKFDFSDKTAKLAIILLLIFPTSFYFASVYTESLFFALSVWSFYFGRRGSWFVSIILSIFLTATRFVGIIMLPVLIVEWYLQNKDEKDFLKKFPKIILGVPAGLLAYMYYLGKTAGNVFAFYTSLSTFGEQRSTRPIFLPQVFYRYIFRIIPALTLNFFPVVFTTFFEFFIGGIYLILSLASFFKLRLSYSLFLLFGYLIPTFSGSFSSMPRYVLILFPAYILFAKFLEGRKIFAFLAISLILLIISFSLFARWYWIS